MDKFIPFNSAALAHPWICKGSGPNQRGCGPQHPSWTHQPENADSSVSLKTCSALQPLNQNLAAVNTSSRIHYSVSGKSNYLWRGGEEEKSRGGGVTTLQRRQSNCRAILEEQIALSKYTDSLQRGDEEYESYILSLTLPSVCLIHFLLQTVSLPTAAGME